MEKKIINQLSELLLTPKKCVIFPHRNPDGDALGSTLALYHFLIKKGHDCTLISPNEYPKFLEWMPGQDNILCFTKKEAQCRQLISEADVFFTLDFNALSRISPIDELIEASVKPIVMIDHHQAPEDYASIQYSDASIGSTCEMVYNTLHALDPNAIDKNIAECLYTGIMTDTGSFRFSATSAKTHTIVANLFDHGINHVKIHEHIYDSSRFERLQLLGLALKNLNRIAGLNAVYTYLSQEELDRCDFEKGETEGFVNYGLSLEGIQLSVILIENRQEGIVKMSFRSKGNFDVNQLAREHFNGGGHLNAAGGVSTTSLEATREKLHAVIQRYSSELS
ncbi:MAG: DHH family phosphoesterase [Flavobacteriaceae bacterium]